jgi:uncharacterized protein (TIGR03000 family)
MYSLVVISALSMAPETTGFHGVFQDWLARWSMRGCQGGEATRSSCQGTFYAGGCSGATYRANCYGVAYPTGCGACQGGGLLERVRRWFDRGNCQSSYATSCYGCQGGMAYYAGCYGSAAYSCYGAMAYSYPPGLSGGTSCQGGWAPLAPPPIVETPGTPAPLPNVPPPTIPYAPPETAPPPGAARSIPNTSPSTEWVRAAAVSSQGERGTIVVHLPADARLYAQGRLLRQTGPERTFVTPPLLAEREYTYTFRAEYQRQEQTISLTRVVKIRPGATVQVTFTDITAPAAGQSSQASQRASEPVVAPDSEKSAVHAPSKSAAHSQPLRSADTHTTDTPKSDTRDSSGGTTAIIPVGGGAKGTEGMPAADTHKAPLRPSPADAVSASARPLLPSAESQARTTLIVRLPPGAVLYVNEQPVPAAATTVRRFVTPPLPVGQEYAYLLRVEYQRSGQREILSQRVTFRAGEQLELSFDPVQ